MSWHCVSTRGANGDRTPYCFARPSTFDRYEAVSALLDIPFNGVSALTAAANASAFNCSRVGGPALPPRPRPPKRPRATAAAPHPPASNPSCPPGTILAAGGWYSCAGAAAVTPGCDSAGAAPGAPPPNG